ncbi:hypothetical protein SAMN05421770_107135 [Granulicella rosea]|uniref:Peptidase M15 n=1 Tax=Granulicella rosea TaxID=474952 RepID=A0A239LME2_9BACT|nr:DUF5715 family protein [Granulicella rosea]SNT31555.1 hypothetical protein SAMN05421770_107135 [Granulicella rosea]
MRANAPFPALLALSGLVLLAPTALAVTHRAPAKAEHSSASKSSKAEARNAKPARGAKAASAKAGKKAEPALKKTSSRKASGKTSEKPEKPSKHGRGKTHEAPEPLALSRVSREKGKHQHAVEAKPEPRLIASKKPAPEPTRVAKLERTEPEPAPAGPEPHVQHNRKVHLEADAPQAPAAAPAVDPHHALSPADLNSGTSHPPTDDESQPMQKSIVELPDPPSSTPAKQTVSVVRLPLQMKEIPVVAPVETATVAPLPSPKLFNEHGRLIMPPPLKGSHEILVRQNVNADADGLERIRDDEDLARMRASNMLVALPLSEGLSVDERLPVDRRYARPWAARFLSDMSRAHYARFQTPLQVNSAVRTVQFQARLIHTNGNAAPFEGETASPHLTGQAVDIAKKGLSQTEIAWMRGYLLPLIQQGKVDVEEEFQQSCFHISVYRKYMPSAAPKRIVVTHRGSAQALAAAMQ